eukprot:Skav231621  [mRNA]  locus=scaffold1638:255757:267802:+ [translate_table: standard]
MALACSPWLLKVLFLLPCLATEEDLSDLSLSQALVADECRAPRDCALNALQLNQKRGRQLVGCHTAVEGDRCFREIEWARNVGMRHHPEWYPNLTLNSSIVDFQKFLFENYPGKCPIPCGIPLPHKWCQWPDSGNLSAPGVGPALSIKAGHAATVDESYRTTCSGGTSISADTDRAFDVMGFQECESGHRVLEPVPRRRDERRDVWT